MDNQITLSSIGGYLFTKATKHLQDGLATIVVLQIRFSEFPFNWNVLVTLLGECCAG